MVIGAGKIERLVCGHQLTETSSCLISHLLRLAAHNSVHYLRNLDDRRRLPRPVGDRGSLFFGPVHSHRYAEIPFPRRQPVDLLVLAGRLLLDIDVDRSVSSRLERHRGAGAAVAASSFRASSLEHFISPEPME